MVDCHLAASIINYLINRPQYVKLYDCMSDVIGYSMGTLQGTLLSQFHTSDFRYNHGKNYVGYCIPRSRPSQRDKNHSLGWVLPFFVCFKK